MHCVEECKGRSDRSQFPLPLHRACAIELKDKGTKVQIGVCRAPNGDVAAISRLFDLGNGAAMRSGGVGDGPDDSALRIELLHQSALDVQSVAPENAPAQDVASV